MFTFSRQNIKIFIYARHFSSHITSTVPLPNEPSALGWIQTVHKLKHKTFIKINDGQSSEIIHVVLNNDLIKHDIRRGNCIKVYGDMTESFGRHQQSEIKAIHYELLSNNDNLIDDQLNTTDRLFSTCKTGLKPEIARKDLLHLRHRLDYFASMVRIRASIKSALRSFMHKNRYLEVDPPHLTQIDCEGAGESYTVTSQAHVSKESQEKSPRLSVSGQLHLEALVLGLGRVYSMATVFRANRSGTRHHLAEFVMLEVESVDLTNETILSDAIETVVRNTIEHTLISLETEIRIVQQSNVVDRGTVDRLAVLRDVLDGKFLRISFEEAVKLLDKQADGGEITISKAEEQKLIELVGGRPLFIVGFPSIDKPFYCKTRNNDCEQGSAMAIDLLMPGVGEVAGGSVREDRYHQLAVAMARTGMNCEADMRWYLELRGEGGCPHGGFGLGFDRLVQFLTGVRHIADVVTFPRTFDTCVL